MSSQVFYRKWRPQTLNDVVGQEHITRTLRNALVEGKVAHAYLFCGSRGTGKTSTGRILAKAVNCLNSVEGEACNECSICQAVSQGQLLDIIEIDAASNRGIDDVRELRERINFAPTSAKYKVYIIDEVHMLTDPASNALLKTLEEPPPHAIFVLATTEPHKLLPTLLSRCQRFDFRRLSQSAIMAKLNHICEQEGIEVEDTAARIMARSVSGSLRDAENLLEQLVTFYGKRIDVSQVEETLGITTDARVKELVNHIVNKDVAAGLCTINSVAGDGVDLRQFGQSVLGYLRNMLLVKPGGGEILDLAPEDLAEAGELASKLPLADILKATKLFAEINFQFDQYSPLLLELALVESTLSQAGIETTRDEQAEVAEALPEPEIVLGKLEPAVVLEEAPTPDLTQVAEVPAPKKRRKADMEFASPEINFEYVKEQWKDFAKSLKGSGTGGTLNGFLNSSIPVAIEGETLVLSCSNFVRDKIEKPENQRLVEGKLKENFGTLTKIRCSVEPSPAEGHLVKAAKQMGAIVVNKEKRDG
jgi:DNA polymerase-3 subunit gamma/tau